MSSSSGTARVTSRILQSTGPRKRALPSNVPSLGDFVHRTTVLKQYRSFLRAIRLIDDAKDRQHAFEEVQREFRSRATLSDKLATQMAVTEGARKLTQVQSMVGYTATQHEGHGEDSWLNTPDPEDPRGRVGTGWPWNK